MIFSRSSRSLVALAVLAAVAAGCADTPTVAPAPGSALPDLAPMTCRGGYAIANRNGEWVCEPIESGTTSTTLSAPTSESTSMTCRGGYAIANRDGELVCEPVAN